MQIQLLFFSTDEYFLQQVTDFISRTQREFQLVTYSDLPKAQDYLSKYGRQVDAILAESYFFQTCGEVTNTKILIDQHTSLNAEDGYYHLNVYQQGENLARDLKKICLQKEHIHAAMTAGKTAKLISFYSVQGGCGQSTVAYQLAASLAPTANVLYLSFDLVNVYQTLYTENYPVDLAQLMFHIKDRQQSRDAFYQAIVRNQHGIYVLPPFQTIGDIVELTEEDVSFLLEQILALEEFDYVLLDLNRDLGAVNQTLLARSNKIVSLYTADAIGQQKQQCAQQDPYLIKLGLLDRVTNVVAKLTQEAEADGQIGFPYVQIGSDLFHSFYENGSFRSACLALQERI